MSTRSARPSPWRREVAEAIEAAQAFGFVISPDAVSSVECRRALDQAIAVGKRLLPVEWRPASDVTSRRSWRGSTGYAPPPDNRWSTLAAALVSAIDVDYRLGARAHAVADQRHALGAHRREPQPVASRRDLAAAESWLARQTEGKEPQPTSLQTRFIVAARQSARRRLQVVAMAALSALV